MKKMLQAFNDYHLMLDAGVRCSLVCSVNRGFEVSFLSDELNKRLGNVVVTKEVLTIKNK